MFLCITSISHSGLHIPIQVAGACFTTVNVSTFKQTPVQWYDAGNCHLGGFITIAILTVYVCTPTVYRGVGRGSDGEG